jgi:hypothetical protein
MSLHFVSTAVLSSEDGIGFEREERRDTDEVRRAAVAARNAEARPLFDQLEIEKAKKQEEYDAVTKLIFGMCSVAKRSSFCVLPSAIVLICMHLLSSADESTR